MMFGSGIWWLIFQALTVLLVDGSVVIWLQTLIPDKIPDSVQRNKTLELRKSLRKLSGYRPQ